MQDFIREKGFKIIFALSVAVLMFLFVYPFLSLIISSFSLSDFVGILKERYVYKLLFNSIKQATLSTLLSFVLGLLGFWFVVRRDFRFKNVFLSISYIPFVLPSILMVLAFVLIFGNRGIIKLDILYSLKAVVLAHACYNFPIIMHNLYESYMNMDRRLENASYTMGADKVYTFFHVTLRQLKTTIISSLLLVFLYSFSSFAIVLTLGGGVRNSTLEVEIYRSFKILGDKSLGMSYVILSMIITVTLLVIYHFISRKQGIERASKRREPKRGTLLDSLFALVLSFVILFPILRIIFSSFTSSTRRNTGSLFSGFIRVFSQYEAIFNSLLVATISSLIVVFLAFVISEYQTRKGISIFAQFSFLPLCVSGIALSQGWGVGLGKGYILTVLALSLTHAFYAFPLVFKIVDSGVRSLSSSSRNVALTLGGGEIESVFMLDLPSLKANLLKAFSLAFSLSLGEVSSALMFSSASFSTLSTSIYNFISRYDYRAGAAAGVILLLFTVLSVFVTIREKNN